MPTASGCTRSLAGPGNHLDVHFWSKGPHGDIVWPWVLQLHLLGLKNMCDVYTLSGDLDNTEPILCPYMLVYGLEAAVLNCIRCQVWPLEIFGWP